MASFKGSSTGLLAFAVVLFVMPLGHAAMILMEHLLGRGLYLYVAAGALGFLGVGLLYLGVRMEGDTGPTWMGFTGGVLVWTGWVEFAFILFAEHLSIPPLVVQGEVVTKPEYLVMTSSVGLFGALLPYYLFSNQTRCHFFQWWQRTLRLGIKPVPQGQGRQVALITFLETIFVLWAFYLLLLIVYDDGFFGDRHPVTYMVFFGSLIWSLYLFIRLLKRKKMGAAIRYAIPTVVIFWNAVEILGRWEFYSEIWTDPLNNWLEMVLILLAFVTAVLLANYTSHERVEVASDYPG